MSYIFSEAQLSQLLPANQNYLDWYAPLLNELNNTKIDNKLRVAAFIAQTSHESNDYSVLKENLNYSAQGLLKIFKKYFSAETAAQYARNPEAIANVVYANRLGNGDASSGDGWRYRGRGIVQITGRANYQAVSQYMYEDDRLLDNPDELLTIDGAVASACWFWNEKNLSPLADAGDIVTISRRINGGDNGMDDRKFRYQRALEILGD